MQREPLGRRRLPLSSWVQVLVAVAVISTSASAIAQSGQTERFEFHDAGGSTPRSIPVWTYAPPHAEPDLPVLFVMHGARRNAKDFLDTWMPLADRYRVIVVAPEFSREAFPRRAMYNAGFAPERKRKHLQGPAAWTFTVVDRLFDEVVRRYGNRSERYFLFGHSAGGQFVHRMLLVMPGRVAGAVSANAGWYSLPDDRLNYPRGLRGADVQPADMERAFRTPLVLLLGSRDNAAWVPTSAVRGMRRTARPPSRPHARAKEFISVAEEAATRRGVDLNWRLQVVPKTGHDRNRMSEVAAAVLFSTRLSH